MGTQFYRQTIISKNLGGRRMKKKKKITKPGSYNAYRQFFASRLNDLFGQRFGERNNVRPLGHKSGKERTKKKKPIIIACWYNSAA